MWAFARDSLILATSNILSVALGFFLSLLVGRGLGEAGFGIWAFCLAWAAMLTMICEFGLNSLLTRDASRFPDELNRRLAASLAIKFIFILILGGAVWLLSPRLSLDESSSDILHVSVLIAVAGLAYGSFTAVFRATRWMAPILWLNGLGALAQLIWSAVILQMGGDALALVRVAAYVDFAQVFVALLLWWIYIRVYGGAFGNTRYDLIRMISEALPFALAGFLGALELRSSVLLLGYVRGKVEVGRFSAASRFSDAARLIPNGIFDSAFPALAAEESGAGGKTLFFRKLEKTILAYSILAAGVLIFFSRQIIQLTYGPSFLSSASALTWLGVAMLPSLHNAVMETYLFATGDEKYATRLGFFGLAVQFFTGLPLMSLYGVSGAAIGILLGKLSMWLPLRRRIKKYLRLTVSEEQLR